MKQKLLILFAFILIGISSKVQAYDFSAVAPSGQTFYYNIKSATNVEVTYNSPTYNNYSGAITIPNLVTNNGITYSVISIDHQAFFGCRNLTSIIIPNSVTSIGHSAFSNCTGLTSVTIPNSVTLIESNTFQLCTSLNSITIPNSVTSIGDGVFYGCIGLTSVTIPNSVTSIGSGAFKNCTSLTSVTIPTSVTSIDNGAFEGTPYYNNMPNGVIYINNVLYKYKGTMPANTTINIPVGIVSISSFAFNNCSGLTSITIPNSVTMIGETAFYSCTSLTSITIPNSVTSIGSYAFSGCPGLTSINVDTNNIMYSSINGILFSKNADKIIYYPYGKKGAYTIPNSVTSIEYGAFYSCSGLTSITIPNSVTSIGEYAFLYCSGLTSVIIPTSVTSIGNYAFEDCSGLASITCKALNPPTIYDRTFSNISKAIPVYIPCGSKSKYQASQYWNEFTNFIDDTNISIHYDTICKGQTYNKYGFNFMADTAGLYTQHLQTIQGCDSIISLILTLVPPSKQDIDMVTVDNNNNNVVVWEKNNVVNHYNIYREGIVMGEYDLIAIVPFDSLGMYTDTNSNPTVKAYMYKVSATDTCINESVLSYFHKTMHLSISQGMGNNWNLNWTPYQGVQYKTYNIYRGINSLDSLKYLTTISSSNTSYTDINVPSGYVYYQIEIIKDTTTSNDSVISKKAEITKSIRSNFATNKVVSLEETLENNTSIRIYPNPAKTNITIDYSNYSSLNKCTIQIYNTLGQMVYNNTINQQLFNIDISKWQSKGLYNVRIIDSANKIIATEKVVVQ